MSAHKPTIYLIAGCNGAGKTTFAKEFLPQEAKCINFLNADLIAQGLSPFDSRAGAVKAGRLLLAEFQQFVARNETFAVESTLSGKTYVGMLSEAKHRGFQIYLHYLWLPSLSIALARVRERVKKGGHDVPTRDIERRFHRSLDQLVSSYAPLADRWAVWDNQTTPPNRLAESTTCTLEQLRKYACDEMKPAAKSDDFIALAERAFRRVSRKLRLENSRLGLPLIVGDKGKLRRIKLKK